MDESITGSAYIEEETGLSMQWVTAGEFLGLVQRGKMNCSISLSTHPSGASTGTATVRSCNKACRRRAAPVV
ncbi:hypothetical protein ACTXJQ_01885, partial [Glutamicibacter ardleyensis]